MIDLNLIAKQGYNNALKRGRINEKMTHEEICNGIMEEFKEFMTASGTRPSVHLPEYSEAAEELADIVLCGLTELVRLGIEPEKIIMDKFIYNLTR